MFKLYIEKNDYLQNNHFFYNLYWLTAMAQLDAFLGFEEPHGN